MTTQMLQLLEELGVDFTRTDHTHYKFFAGGFMDLIVETWQHENWLHVSVAHYYEQEGDLMSDPEIEFRVPKICIEKKQYDAIQAISYTQHNLGIYQEALVFDGGHVYIDVNLQKSIRSFLKTWAENLKQQGFKPKPKEGEVEQ